MIVVMTSKTITVYGIPNCDTVKKARAWLTAQGLNYEFHDFKKQGVPEVQLDTWLKRLGWEKLVNRKGNTWRGLDAATQASVVDTGSAIAVIKANSSVIQRPVVQWPSGQVTVGFDATAWGDLVKHQSR